MEFNDLKDKHEKADVFDMVNDTFLNLKGDRRRILRSQFMNVWKQNKNVGCADLFMALFNSIDRLESWERSLREEDNITQDDHKTEMKEALGANDDKHSEEMLDLERKHKSEILALRRRVASAEASEANAVKMYEMASKCANMQES